MLFSCLLTLSSLVAFSVAYAGVQSRPSVEGYSYGSPILYRTAEAYATFFCNLHHTNGIPEQLDHIEYVSTPTASNPHPQFYWYCAGDPDKYGPSNVWGYGCVGDKTLSLTPQSCTTVTDKPPVLSCDGKPANSFGDPIDMSAKEATLQEKDYASAQGLSFIRYYSSSKLLPNDDGMQQGWRHNYAKRLTSTKILNNANVNTLYSAPNYYMWTQHGWSPSYAALPPNLQGVAQDFAYLTRPDGHSYYFISSDNGATWKTDSDVNYKLLTAQIDSSGNVLQWQVLTPEHDTETYDQIGRLVSLRSRSGRSQMLIYSDAGTPAAIAPQPNLLLQVTDNFGASLHFQYDSSSRLSQMTDAAGLTYTYAYDANNNLVSITYPDGLKRQYLYIEPAYDFAAGTPTLNHLLTGVANEISSGNIVRYTTFTYDASGNPTSTQLANGVNKYTLNYNSNVVTDPLGTQRTYSYSQINGLSLLSSVSDPAGAGCNGATSHIYYETANGTRTSSMDFNGNVTTYTYDLSRNLETQRVEGSGTAQARTTSTQWHPQYRLPTLIAEPGKRTTLTYDSHGNPLSQAEQATGDGNGSQGFNAAPIGPARTWSYTYNDVGQVLTATDPNGNMTSYSYDSQGNLVSVRNAAGHVTSLSNYDANGRARRIVDPNGVTTELTYSPRGWLTSRKVGGELTTYGYDGVGQLTKVTHPDGSFLAYTYDAAHRLTEVADSAGDSIHYTLDAMGNRITEQARDANGMLARQITRAYDALNRLQQITGGGQ